MNAAFSACTRQRRDHVAPDRQAIRSRAAHILAHRFKGRCGKGARIDGTVGNCCQYFGAKFFGPGGGRFGIALLRCL